MDPRFLLAFNEAVMDAPVETAAAPATTDAPPEGDTATAETVETATETTAAPAFTSEQIAALRETPEFRDFLAEEAAQIADARFDERVRQFQEQQTAPAETPDISDPFSEDFGPNLLSAIEQVVARAVSPLQQTNEQTQEAARDAAITTAVTERTKAAGLPEAAASTVRSLAEAYAPQLNQQYGPARGAEMAMTRALSELSALTGEAKTVGGQSAIDQLAAVAGADTTIAGNGGAVSTPPAAKSPAELFQSRFGQPL